ncbi:hypothetical protein KUTeg_009142 [Tegillarca granosa]|uniref:Uncharacterized protein n=1 Tax=Tegillarca granosa TaxID=220873 RepID=A0ABQ9F7J6_TEGGR|nr:hypothetical protein KUTeg_009142 [Tegillarca granosa]
MKIKRIEKSCLRAFWKNNLNTPVTSQNLFDSDTEESEDGFCVVDLAERARRYLEENEGSDINESLYSSDEENRNDIINHILLPIDDPNLYKIIPYVIKGVAVGITVYRT